MTIEDFKKKMAQGTKYQEIKDDCEKILQLLISKHEIGGFSRKKYNFSKGTPLGYAFLKKPRGYNFNAAVREQEAFFWIDINNEKSEEFNEFSDMLLSAKKRGSINPFNWTIEEIEIIQNCDPYINAKSETIPIKGLHGNNVGFMRINKK